jgi:Fe-S-cluster-containing dehydrogenase component
MDKDRRNFIKTVIHGSLLITVFPLIPSRVHASRTPGHMYAFIVDTERCIGCGKCVDACKKENNVPEEFYRTWVERYTVLEDGEVIVDSSHGGSHGFKPLEIKAGIEKSFFVPKLCNHCKKPNCVQVCPVGATYVSMEGVVLVDEKHCVGCSYCLQACPYGARYIHPERKTADKCTWCYHRVKKGLEPACVLVCPAGARQFGRVDDPKSPVCRILKEKRLQVLKPETGNRPMTFYVGLDKEVR